jgi:hypothetical protein
VIDTYERASSIFKRQLVVMCAVAMVGCDFDLTPTSTTDSTPEPTASVGFGPVINIPVPTTPTPTPYYHEPAYRNWFNGLRAGQAWAPPPQVDVIIKKADADQTIYKVADERWEPATWLTIVVKSGRIESIEETKE